MKVDQLMPIHPGEVLLEEFLKPMNINKDKMALALKISIDCLNEIIDGKGRITADIALRLAHYFNMSPQFWLGLQMDYDLDIAKDEMGEQIAKEVISLINS